MHCLDARRAQLVARPLTLLLTWRCVLLAATRSYYSDYYADFYVRHKGARGDYDVGKGPKGTVNFVDPETKALQGRPRATLLPHSVYPPEVYKKPTGTGAAAQVVKVQKPDPKLYGPEWK